MFRSVARELDAKAQMDEPIAQWTEDCPGAFWLGVWQTLVPVAPRTPSGRCVPAWPTRRPTTKSLSSASADFVIELRSASDRLFALRRKMHEFIENGAQLGWLIDPPNRTVEIYRPGAEPEIRPDLAAIEGEGPVAGFLLDLAFIWNPRG